MCIYVHILSHIHTRAKLGVKPGGHGTEEVSLDPRPLSWGGKAWYQLRMRGVFRILSSKFDCKLNNYPRRVPIL